MPVPNKSARFTHVNSLHRVVTWWWNCRQSNLLPVYAMSLNLLFTVAALYSFLTFVHLVMNTDYRAAKKWPPKVVAVFSTPAPIFFVKIYRFICYLYLHVTCKWWLIVFKYGKLTKFLAWLHSCTANFPLSEFFGNTERNDKVSLANIYTCLKQLCEAFNSLVDRFLWQAGPDPDHLHRFFEFQEWHWFWMELVIGLQCHAQAWLSRRVKSSEY